jgi:hypothetical protein
MFRHTKKLYREVQIITNNGAIQWGIDTIYKSVELPEGTKEGDTVLLECIGVYRDTYCVAEVYKILAPPIARNWRGNLLVLPIELKSRKIKKGEIIGRVNQYSYRILPPLKPKILKGVFICTSK